MGLAAKPKPNKRRKAKKTLPEVQIEKIIDMLSRLPGSKRKESQISCKIPKQIKSKFKNGKKVQQIDYEEDENLIHKRRRTEKKPKYKSSLIWTLVECRSR